MVRHHSGFRLNSSLTVSMSPALRVVGYLPNSIVESDTRQYGVDWDQLRAGYREQLIPQGWEEGEHEAASSLSLDLLSTPSQKGVSSPFCHMAGGRVNVFPSYGT